MSRCLEENYYITKKGKIALNWSPPEVGYNKRNHTPRRYYVTVRSLIMASSALPVMSTAMGCYCMRYGPMGAGRWPTTAQWRCGHTGSARVIQIIRIFFFF